MNEIEVIASKHLGKAGDGSVVKPYVTPDTVDASLLVGVPRILNRTAYEIDEDDLPFKGADTWNCYEFSTLTNNGFPVTGLMRIVYNSNSKCIVESKSLKLYLNSFNMMRNGDTVEEVIENVEYQVYNDLTPLLFDTPADHSFSYLSNGVQVALVFEDSNVTKPITGDFWSIENYIDPTRVSFDHFNESPDILEVIDSSDSITNRWRSAVLRSNCRVTNQPDWGDVYIAIRGKKTVTPTSLLQYIVSMRKENHFHEEICECIYKRLYDLLAPEELFVTCLYTRRGGIDINPVRADSVNTINKYGTNLVNEQQANFKTLRQ